MQLFISSFLQRHTHKPRVCEMVHMEHLNAQVRSGAFRVDRQVDTPPCPDGLEGSDQMISYCVQSSEIIMTTQTHLNPIR